MRANFIEDTCRPHLALRRRLGGTAALCVLHLSSWATPDWGAATKGARTALALLRFTSASLLLKAVGNQNDVWAQEYKYPRRLRTGRPVTDDGQEINPVGDDWVPQDEDFDQIKSVRTDKRHTAMLTCSACWGEVVAILCAAAQVPQHGRVVTDKSCLQDTDSLRIHVRCFHC